MQFDETIRRILFRLRGRVIHLKPAGKARGTVLFSYVTLPFLNRDKHSLNMHTNRWESMDMAETFIERGYAVDIIDISNSTFLPRKKYDFFIDNGHQMERLAPLLNQDCIKIFHITTSDWKFQNEAEQKRFDDLYKRRGAQLKPDRVLKANKTLELCDIASMLGNSQTASTYAYGNREIIPIPLSTTHTFPSPEKKDFDRARKNFVWFGGAGVIHKGLDLVVEAFAQMPEYSLTICGKLDGEKDFKEIYKKELSLPNIKIAGFMDPGSQEFKELCDTTLGLVYPSCSEGQAGSVIVMMHAGVIPIISRESGVDAENFGVILKENTIAEIMLQVREISLLPTQELQRRALAGWEYAQEHHTRERFAKEYRKFVDMIITKYRI
jgi:glycosyltransferase involved in cell wall biosynthesis